MAGYFEKTKSGKYRLFVSGGTGPNKKRQRYTKTVAAKSDREADKLLAQFVAEVEKGQFLEPSKFTFEEFTEKWLSDYAEKNLAPKTLHRYKKILETRIVPAIGHLKLEKIKPIHLLEFYKNLQEDGIREDKKEGGLSAKTILQHHRIISSMLNDAVQWQFIQSNPASRVKPPKVQKKQMPCYDEEQTSLLLQAVQKENLKHQALVLLALFSGLRRGEIMGLEWQDLNFEKATLTVRQASQYIPGRGAFTKEPKNETSERLLSIPPFLVDILRQFKKEQAKARLKVGDLWRGSGVLSNFTELFDAVTPKEVLGAQLLKSLRKQSGIIEKWKENIQAIANLVKNEDFIQELRKFGANAAPEIAALKTLSDKQLQEFVSLWQEKRKNYRGGRLFVTWDGRPAHPEWPSQWFSKFIKKHELPPLNFHGLRHTSATMLINQGLPAKSISGRLGHSNISTTMDLYGHYLKSADKEAADRLEQVYQTITKKQNEQAN